MVILASGWIAARGPWPYNLMTYAGKEGVKWVLGQRIF